MKMPPMNIPPMKAPPCENYPPPRISLSRKLPPVKIAPPGKITPNQISSPLINHRNERKNKIKIFFPLKKAVQKKNTENTGLRYFLYIMKKNSKNRTKAQIAKWHLLASCTSQGELKLGSQIIKFGK